MKRRQVTNGMVDGSAGDDLDFMVEILGVNLRVALIRSLLVEVGENDGEDEESIGTTP
jgi:hypothetical protein